MHIIQERRVSEEVLSSDACIIALHSRQQDRVSRSDTAESPAQIPKLKSPPVPQAVTRCEVTPGFTSGPHEIPARRRFLALIDTVLTKAQLLDCQLAKPKSRIPKSTRAHISNHRGSIHSPKHALQEVDP
jgi:hypothetical protein